MVITALYNILHLGRIDISLLHRSAETYDPGKTSAWLPLAQTAIADICSNPSLQVLHPLPEGGGQPVPPGDEGVLRPAAGPDGGERSCWEEDEGRRRR